jgi:2'-5' RNA ligase
MANTIRTFVAVPVPGAVTGFIAQIQKRLKTSRINIRWIPAANIHLTLKFLGDIEPARVPEIKTQLNVASRSTAPFVLNAKGIGVFPNRRQARVMWVGLIGDLSHLERLKQNIESGLTPLGFKRDRRPFRAHLTIGRMRQRPDPKALDVLLEPLKDDTGEPFTIDQIRFYQSVLRPSGAEYKLLHTASLAVNGTTA